MSSDKLTSARARREQRLTQLDAPRPAVPPLQDALEKLRLKQRAALRPESKPEKAPPEVLTKPVSRRAPKGVAETPFAQPVKSSRPSARRTRATPPPVLVRSGLEGMATTRKGAAPKKPAAPRRRFDVALSGVTGVPGAEVRLPSVLLSWMDGANAGLIKLVSGLLACMMLLSLYFLLFSPTFQVQTVEVKGVERLSTADILLVLGVSGAQVVTLDAAELEKNLSLAFPDLESVDVRIGLPGRLVVTAVERQPVLRWLDGNTEQWLDASGIIFPARGDGSALFTVQGDTLPGLVEEPLSVFPGAAAIGQTNPAFLTKRRLAPEMVTKILALQTVVPAGTPLLFSEAKGFGWLDPQGWEVYFGSQTTDLEQRLALYQQIVQHLNQTGQTPALISVEFLHSPYYRMER